MKLTKKQCRDISSRITNEEILTMLEKAKSNIVDWKKPSNISSKLSKGKIWNMLVKDLQDNIDNIDNIPVSDKYILLKEYGEYVPFHLLDHKYPKPEKKKEKQIIHEEPIFENSNKINYESLDSLLKEVLILECTDKIGIKCEICGNYFQEAELMGAHILGKKSHPRLRYIRENVLLLCNDCHKDLDENNRLETLKKISVIKNIPDIETYLKSIYENVPLLKEQNIREDLKLRIKELNEKF